MAGQWFIGLYFLGVVVVTGWFFFRWPIVAHDTDLWYHLSSARYLAVHHAIPDRSFFSFLEPPRPWVNYFWLFQILVYKIYEGFGYPGLIVSRALLFLATQAVIFQYLVRSGKGLQPFVSIAFLVGLFAAVMLPRSLMVRPHLVSYLFIITFLWILEYAPRRALWLIPLAIVWVNIHGIAYPVMLCILLAYLLEFAVRRWRLGRALSNENDGYVVPAVVALGSVFLTPHGLRLLAIPWRSTHHASTYIQELLPVTLSDLSSFVVSGLTATPQTLFNLLLLVAGLAAIIALTKRPLRISHLCLFIAGVLLLLKGNRFHCECALLSLPVLATNPLVSASDFVALMSQGRKLVMVLAIGFLLTLPFTDLLDAVSTPPPRYPFARNKLPLGVVAFLQQIGVGGNILNQPNSGGYLQWALYPRYTIFMDMEVPFLFSDEDMYQAVNLFTNETVLRAFLAQYHPVFISVPIEEEKFPDLAQKFPDYVPVFFDEVEVLYCHRPTLPDLATQYELKTFKPFQLKDTSWNSTVTEENMVPLMQEARRLLAVDPDGKWTNSLAAYISLKEEAFDRALPYAEAIIRTFPEVALGYKLKGDALTGLRAFPEALAVYDLDPSSSRNGADPAILKGRGLVSLALHRDREAYEKLTAAISIFSPSATFGDLYALGTAAERVGRHAEAAQIFRFAWAKVPQEESKQRQAVRGLARLGITVEGLNVQK